MEFFPQAPCYEQLLPRRCSFWTSSLPLSISTRQRNIFLNQARKIRIPYCMVTVRQGLQYTVNAPRQHYKMGEDHWLLNSPHNLQNRGTQTGTSTGTKCKHRLMPLRARISATTRAHRRDVEKSHWPQRVIQVKRYGRTEREREFFCSEVSREPGILFCTTTWQVPPRLCIKITI